MIFDRRIGRFAIVGISNTAVSFVVFYLCYREWQLASRLLDKLPALRAVVVPAIARLGAESIDGAFANALGYACGMLNSFIWNRTWTFQVTDAPRRRFLRFALLNVSAMTLSSLAIFAAVDVLALPYSVSWLTVGVVFTVLSFLANKVWVFGDAG